MRDADLGINDFGKHDAQLTSIEQNCLDKLQQRGYGKAAAISANDLAWATGFGSHDAAALEANKRELRHIINHLIITHGLPIICQAGLGGGYYLASNPSEVEANYQAFHRRAMTSLLKASRGRKGAYVDMVSQLTLGFDDPEQQAALERLRLTPEADPVPAWVQLMTRFLDRLAADPEGNAEAIRRIQKEYGTIFVEKQTMKRLKEETAKFQTLLREIEERA